MFPRAYDMMRRRTVLVGIVIVAIIIAIALPAIQRARGNADKAGCLYRFQSLSQFAATFHQTPPERLKKEVPQAIPPGTLLNPDLPPDRRLSWIPDVLPFLDQKMLPKDDLRSRIERSGAWDSPTNLEVAKTRLLLFTCPGAIPEPLANGLMPTQFVGLSGIGPDSATLSLGPPVPPLAGCFRYDAPTPLALIRQNDGLSSTLLFGETASELGPWTRGGFATVRGLNLGDGAKPPIGVGGQFGGNYPSVAGFSFADGSARFFRDDTSREVMWALMTIAGKGTDPLPGE